MNRIKVEDCNFKMVFHKHFKPHDHNLKDQKEWMQPNRGVETRRLCHIFVC